MTLLAMTLAFAPFSSTSSWASAQDNYGAIATSDSGTAYGFSYDYSSQSEAEAAAVSSCGANCSARVWFFNSCGAVAENPEWVAWGLGDSQSEAEDAALSACPECEIVA